ncbi:MAG: ATP-binding protein, partial [Pseudomonadota bacterium]
NDKRFVHVDPTYFLEAVLNLLDNAMVHAEGTETVTLATEILPGGRVAIDVLDEGPGMDATLREAVGEPFMPGRAVHDGIRQAGLGLFIVKRFADAHGGQLRLDNRDQGGLRARMDLPLVAAPR